MNVAGYDVSYYVSDKIRLDGGAMFGSVPKTLWNKKIEADEKNRIPLCCRLLILRSKDHSVLVDVGCGLKWSEKELEIYAIEPQQSTPLGETLPGITDVVITHLHFDHAGGISYLTPEGKLRASFPDAKTYVSKKNFEHAQIAGVRERASYISNNIEPLRAESIFCEDGQEILPGIKVFQADGHTKGLQWILVGEGEGAVAYPSDLMPTSRHIPVPYVMGYDLSAETAMAEKEAFLKRAVEEKWVVVFEHDPDTPAATIGKDERGRYSIDQIVELKEEVAA